MTVRGTSATALFSQLVKDLPAASAFTAPKVISCSCKASRQLVKQVPCISRLFRHCFRANYVSVPVGEKHTILASNRKGKASRKPMMNTAIAAEMTGLAYLKNCKFNQYTVGSASIQKS